MKIKASLSSLNLYVIFWALNGMRTGVVWFAIKILTFWAKILNIISELQVV